MATVTNTASARGTNTLLSSDNVIITVNNPATTLTVSNSASPLILLVGETLVYTITVTNGGSATATNVVLEDAAPAQISFDYAHAATTIGTIDSTSTSNYIKVNVGDLNAAASAVITIPALAIST